MTEWLALPPPGSTGTGIDAWASQFSDSGHPARVDRHEFTWIEVPSLKLRGFVVFEGDAVEAINFELSDPSALASLESTATALGWELHPDDGEDDDD